MENMLLTRFQSAIEHARQEPQSIIAREVQLALAEASWDVRIATYWCAVPRYFDAAVLCALVGQELSSERVQIVFDELQALPLVQQYDLTRQGYRAGVREYLLAELRAADQAVYIELHRRAHQYFDQELRLAGHDNDYLTEITRHQADAMREKLYHLIFSMPARGFEELDRLFIEAYRRYLFGDSTVLTAFGQENPTLFQSPLDWLRLDYFEAWPAYTHSNYENARDMILDMLSHDVPPHFRAWLLTRLGNVYNVLAQHDRAVEVLEQSRQIWDALEETRYGAIVCNNLGEAYMGTRDLRRAEQCFEKGLTSFAGLSDYAGQAMIYNNLGNVRAHQERWQLAIELYERSLDIKQQIGDLFGVATTQTNLGTILHRLSQNALNRRQAAEQRVRAVRCYAQSAALFRQLGLRTSLVKPLYRLGLLYFQQQQFDLGRQCVDEVLEIAQALDLPELEGARKLARRLQFASRP